MTMSRELVMPPHMFRQASCSAPEVSGTDGFPERRLPVQVIDRPVD